jgi:hypothetical protein
LITYATKPATETAVTANVGALGGDTLVEYDVTALVKGGTYNFSLVPDSSDSVSFNSSKNSATTKRPQFIIVTTTG